MPSLCQPFPSLTLRKELEWHGHIEVAPLRNLPVIKDLVTDMSEFFDKWAKARGSFKGSTTRKDGFAQVSPESKERKRVDAGIECIGCGVCYSACDVVAANPDYLGPAALNRAWTLVNDVRDSGNRARLAAVAGDAGCHACHTHMSCSERCPKQISPTASIAGLKRAAMEAALKFAKYDHQLVMGTGKHSGRHGGAIFPETMRWIWRDWKTLQP